MIRGAMRLVSIYIAVILVSASLTDAVAKPMYGSDSDEIARALKKADFQSAIPLLEKCMISRGLDDPYAPVSCAIALGGIYRAQGSLRDWARVMHWVHSKENFTTLKAQGGRDHGEYRKYLDGRIHFEKFANAPPTIFSHGTTPLRIPLVEHAGERSDIPRGDHIPGRYAVSLVAGGVQEPAVVDTGSIDFIRMTAATADRLGIVDVLGPTLPMSLPHSGLNTQDVDDEFRIAKALSVGGISIENAVVRVDSAGLLKATVVGFGFLSRFRNVMFSPREISLDLDSPPPGCRGVGYAFAKSVYMSSSSFLVEARYDGEDHAALIDTGMPGTVAFVNPLARAIVSSGNEKDPSLVGREGDGNARLGQTVEIGALEIGDTQAIHYVQSIDGLPYQIVIGAGLKEKANLYMDFASGGLCFSPLQSL